MDYFQILNMKKEPFSNSPGPEFFFHSDQYVACLQNLELAIRLRRGLNVVIGDVGTGKTTLCRQLILNFSRTDEDRKNVETHLILDTSFRTAQEFLSAVALLLGVDTSTEGQSEWQLKESIKNYLFRQGVKERKTVVLIIDEGQKLPKFCLEILRNFLNYETNEYKLLQIVIFAQKEFELVLRTYHNFADRVNQYYFLEPLKFGNIRKMISFRLARASSNPAVAPSIFTFPALWAIYRACGGYPRKIITLCHQVILAMIIQNRTRAGFFLVRSCVDRVSPLEKARRPRWTLTLILAGLLLSLVFINYVQTDMFTSAPDKVVRGASPPANAQVSPSQATSLPEDGGTALPGLASEAGANSPINDLTNIPTQPTEINPLPEGKYWVQIASLNNLKDASELLTVSQKALPLILLKYWTERDGLTFAILLKEGYNDKATALSVIKVLPPSFAARARVVNGWSKDTIFFRPS